MQFYTKDESGNFNEATKAEIDDLFKEESERIVAKKLATAREKELKKIRPELEEQIRKETLDTLRAEAKTAAEEEMQAKLDSLTKAKETAEIKLRQKTIAAEYGFKPETEEFLGSGTEDEMRAKADTLKSSFTQSSSTSYPEKKGADAPTGSDFVTLVKK